MNHRRANGAAIREFRQAFGIPHGVLAVDSDISPGYLTNIEKGARTPSPTVTAAIAKRLGVSLDAITYVVTTEQVA